MDNPGTDLKLEDRFVLGGVWEVSSRNLLHMVGAPSPGMAKPPWTCTGVLRSSKTEPPKDPFVGLAPFDSPRGVAFCYERGTPVTRQSSWAANLPVHVYVMPWLEFPIVGSEGMRGRWGTPSMALHTA